jgi:hypothetical protein
MLVSEADSPPGLVLEVLGAIVSVSAMAGVGFTEAGVRGAGFAVTMTL